MRKHTSPRLGTKSTLRTLARLAALALAVGWMVGHPYQVRHGVDQLSTFVTVVSGGGH